MTKRARKYEIIRICKINYYPKYWQHREGDRLNLYIHGVREGGGFVKKVVLGTQPHFWVKQNPSDVLDHEDFNHVAKYDRQGYHNGELLYRIYTYFPWEVPAIRDKFDWTGEADIKYDTAVRWFYGWEHFIRVPTREKIHVDEIEPISDERAAELKHKYPLRKLVIDIETPGDEFAEAKHPSNAIASISAYDMVTDEIYCAVTKDVSASEVKAALSDEKWLREHLTYGVDEEGVLELPDVIEPIDPDKIHVKVIKSDRWDRWAEEEKECKLLEWLRDLLQHIQPNIIEGHNIEHFDVAYMRERTKVRRKAQVKWNRKYPDKEQRMLMPRIDWERFALADSMVYYKQLHDGEVGEAGRKALSWMGIELMGYGKISHTGIKDIYENNVELLCIYNIWDCVLVARADRVWNMSDFHIDKAEFSGSALEYATKNMPLVESYLAHWFRENTEEIMPSIMCIPRRKRGKISGAYVHPAPEGFFTNVIEFDNKMQYPALFITCNLDTTTLIHDDDEYKGPHSTLPSGRQYRLDPEGTMPHILRDLVLKREEIQARMKECKLAGDEEGYISYKNQDRVFKFFMNSFYGVLASGTTEKTKRRPMRLADHRIGEDITTGAVAVLKYNKEFIESFEYELIIDEMIIPLSFTVIYQDTDSCKTIVRNAEKLEKKYGFKFTEELLEEIGRGVSEALNESYTEFSQRVFNTPNHAFFIKVDSVSKSYYQWGKKKYYVYTDFDDKITYKGFKIKRADSTFLEKMFLRLFFEGLMKGVSLGELSKLVRQFESDIRGGAYRWQTGKSIGISSNKHWGWPAAEWSNQHLGKNFVVGESRPVLYYVKAVKNVRIQPPYTSGKERRVALEWGDDPEDFGLILDYNLIINKYLNNQSTKAILKPLGTSYPNLRDGGMKQKSWADYDEA